MPVSIAPDDLQAAIESRFQCLRCGNCCKGEGLVHFSKPEAEAMARQLGISRREFLQTHAIRVEAGQWILKDKFVELPPDPTRREQWCVLLERDAEGRYLCRVNEAKPNQCRSFPAKWRNEDSFKTCLGLKTLVRELRQEVKDVTAQTSPIDP